MDSNNKMMSGVQNHHHHSNGGGGGGDVVSTKPPAHGRRRQRQQQHKHQGIKVVYISSPMMLTASAEEFRAVVQEFTGRDSNVADHDLAAPAPSSSSNNSASTSSSCSSFGRASPTTGQTMAAATPGRPVADHQYQYAAGGMLTAPPSSFQGMYDQTGSLLCGQQDYYW